MGTLRLRKIKQISQTHAFGTWVSHDSNPGWVAPALAPAISWGQGPWLLCFLPCPLPPTHTRCSINTFLKNRWMFSLKHDVPVAIQDSGHQNWKETEVLLGSASSQEVRCDVLKDNMEAAPILQAFASSFFLFYPPCFYRHVGCWGQGLL